MDKFAKGDLNQQGEGGMRRSAEAEEGKGYMDEEFIGEGDMAFEEDVRNNPHSVRPWWRYIQHKLQAEETSQAMYMASLNSVCERALHVFPGSYKLWLLYLRERRKQLKGLTSMSSSQADGAGERFEKVNDLFERSLITMHKMPRIWMEYCLFMVQQCHITRSRRLFDRALRALPLAQHQLIWPLYIKFVKKFNVIETGVRVYRRYLKYEPSAVEEFIAYLKEHERFDEAAERLGDIVNSEKYASKNGKTQYELWGELCDTLSKNPENIKCMDVERVIRSGIERYTDTVGRLWICLADYFIRTGQFERARDVFEESMKKVQTVRDFSQIFDGYAQFEESIINMKMEDDGDDDDVEIDMRMERLEFLMSQRPLLVNEVLLRQNPNDVPEWLKRVKLVEKEPLEAIKVYSKAISTINPMKVSGSLGELWISFAKFYGDRGQQEEARTVFERATEVKYKNLDDLATVWCEYAEFELSLENFDKALELMSRATRKPPTHKGTGQDKKEISQRAHKSLKLWSFYVDLEESLGTFQSTRDVYDKIFDLKIASPQMVINYAHFLEENKYFEDAFQIYERGTTMFKWPLVYDIWNCYLTKFIERYNGMKIERTRDIFEQCLETCEPAFAKPLYLLYAKFEEEHGLSRHAMAVYERATAAVQKSDKFEMFTIYIKRVAETFGLPRTRDIYEKGIEALPDKEAKELCLRYAELERKLGEIDRARGIYSHASVFANPRVDEKFWKIWSDFEVKHGNEDTFREMLRIKRSVAAQYSTHVDLDSLISTTASGSPASTNPSQFEGARKDSNNPLVQFVSAKSKGSSKKTEAQVESSNTMPSNPDEIELGDDDEDDSEDNGVVDVEEKSVPTSVYGGIKK
eukprot:Nk52_evm11s155 gene=Nk52_evmTU11s155